MFKTVVVGADDSPTAREAVRAAIDLVKSTGGTLHIVTAYRRSPRVADVDRPHELADHVSTVGMAESLLQDLASVARSEGVEALLHAEREDPAPAIVKVAEEERADLIVVGNKGMKGLGRVLGSVPNDVAHRAPCSVLIVQTT